MGKFLGKAFLDLGGSWEGMEANIYFTHCNVTAEDEGKETMEDFCSLPMCQDLKAQLGEE